MPHLLPNPPRPLTVKVTGKEISAALERCATVIETDAEFAKGADRLELADKAERLRIASADFDGEKTYTLMLHEWLELGKEYGGRPGVSPAANETLTKYAALLRSFADALDKQGDDDG